MRIIKKLILMFALMLLISSLASAMSQDEAKNELAKMNIPFSESNFMLYSRLGNEAVVKLFLEAGMEADVRNPSGWTALMSAAGGNHLNVVKLLLDHGADVNARTLMNETPLYYAAMTGGEEVIKELMVRGANPNIKTNYGFTAIQMAKNMGRQDIVILLTSRSTTNTKALYPEITSKTSLVLLDETGFKLAQEDSKNIKKSDEWNNKLGYSLGTKSYNGFLETVTDLNFQMVTPYSAARYSYYMADVRYTDVTPEDKAEFSRIKKYAYIWVWPSSFPANWAKANVVNVVIRKNGIIYKSLPPSESFPQIFSTWGVNFNQIWAFPIDLFSTDGDIEIIAVDSLDKQKILKLSADKISKLK